MLTTAQEQIISATAPVVADHLEDITSRFYPIMFDRYPEVRPLFNATHQREGTQPRALAGAVLAYVQMRQQPEQTKHALRVAIDKHVSLGITPEQYPIVGECLMMAIGEVLGDAVTEDVADAWAGLYGELADLLIEVEAERADEFAARSGGWRGTREFRIAETADESANIRSFVCEPADGLAVAAHEPGQYIGIKVDVDGETVFRHYSLSDVPNGRTLRLSIKHEEGGRMSEHFHTALGVGSTVEFLPAAGDLTLVEGDDPLLLISGGVGQTPLLPIARHGLSQGRNVVYVHSAHDADHHAFVDEVAELAQTYPDQLRVVTVHTANGQGSVDAQLLGELLTENMQCYYVGPQGFMTVVDAALVELGVPDDRRHFEQFGPSRPLTPA